MKKLISIAVFLVSYICVAQRMVDGDIVPMAPDSWSFIKYGNQSMSDLYTGTLHVSIPIYTYNDPDFELPIALSYSTSGYLPNRTVGVTGLGWTLESGGVVTREIRGIPDDHSDSSLNGTLARNLSTIYDANPFIDPRPYVDENGLVYYSTGAGKVETLVDVYSFRFPGHSGKFVLLRASGQNKYIPLFFDTSSPAGEYQIDSVERNPGHEIYAMTIITGDGYRYRFGTESYEPAIQTKVSVDRGGGFSPVGYPSEERTEWFLSRITAPNGRTVLFEYGTSFDAVSMQPFVSYRHIEQVYNVDGNEWQGQFSRFFNIFNPLRNGTSVYESGGGVTYGRRKCEVPCTILTEVSIPDVSWNMSLSYSNRHREGYCVESTVDTMVIAPLKQLDSLEISCGTTLLKKAKFSYLRTPDQGNRVLLLKRLSLSGEGQYCMNYSRETGFPYQGTSSVDHWGYLNRMSPSYHVQDMMPAISIVQGTMDQVIDTVSSHREPSLQAALLGCLTKLTYPTGGYTLYTYEENKYSHVVRRKSTGGYELALYEESGRCGGLRIKTITDYPVGAPPHKVTFEYRINGQESGILMRYPQYFNTYDRQVYKNGILNKELFSCVNSWNVFSYPVDAYHICYPSVSLIESDGSRTETDYTSFKDYLFADYSCDDYRLIDPDIQSLTELGYGDHATMFSNSRVVMRGRVMKRRYYEANSMTPWKEETIEYDNTDITMSPYVSGLDISGNFIYERKTYVNSCLPVLKTETLIEGTDSLKRETILTYNDYNQLSSTESRDYGMGTATLFKTQYSSEISAQGSPVLYRMKELNMTGLPIRTMKSSFRSSPTPQSGQYYLEEGRKFIYGLNGDMVCLDTVKIAKIHGQRASDFSFDADLVTGMTYKYNALNRPVEIGNRVGRKTTVLWGYNGLYPVAKIENASNSTVNNLLGITLSGNSLSGSISSFQETLLYNSTDFETHLIEWLPFTGPTRICDPSHRSASYRYDDFGRLIQTADDHGLPVSAYKYHIEGE